MQAMIKSANSNSLIPEEQLITRENVYFLRLKITSLCMHFENVYITGSSLNRFVVVVIKPTEIL